MLPAEIIVVILDISMKSDYNLMYEFGLGGSAMERKENEKVQRINCLSNDLEMVYHYAARKLKVSDSVLIVLYMIYEKGDGCLLYDICRDSCVSKQTINSAIRKLEREEILYLEQDKGKRKRVFLTEKGQRHITKTAARLYRAECDAMKDWTDEELEEYLRLMKKYTDSLRGQIEKMEEVVV